ncbi:MAG TPA: FtsX-like permease family protein [Dehalococcoidia bacterium]
MKSLFGLPMSDLLVACLAMSAVLTAVTLFLAGRNAILLRLALRKATRRPGRTALVVVGLMLGTTMITAAFATGDTMAYSVRSSVKTSMGNIDEVVSAKGSSPTSAPGAVTANRADYFDQAVFDQLKVSVPPGTAIDGLAPVISEGVAVQDETTRQNEPVVTLFAAPAAALEAFGPMRLKAGPDANLATLPAGEVLLNEKGAEKLGARPGDQLQVFAAGSAVPMKVRSVVAYNGTGSNGPAVIMDLTAAQTLLGSPGRINYIIVSNEGGTTSGSANTDSVIAALDPALERLGLEIDPTKQDQLKFADEAGSVFTSMFATFGSFSVVAGTMLIFLIFVMVAAERKPEMGIARAVGTQRGHLVVMFAFEGLIYDVLAAALGSLLGVLVAAGMVLVMAQAFGDAGFNIDRHVELRSLAIAYTMGVVLTFLVVTFSAWRVSVLNIVAAIRNLPERVAKGKGRGGWLWGMLLALLGVVLVYAGISSAQATPFTLGVSFVLIAFVPLMRRAGAPDRFAYSVSGLLLAFFWLTPDAFWDTFLPTMSHDFSLFVVGGTLSVVGATWVVMYNSELVLGSLMALFGRFRLMAPVVKTSVSRALNNRFRTGMAVAMFSLVVLTLVVMATVTGSVWKMMGDEKTFNGGFDVMGTTLRISPIVDMSAAIAASPELDRADFTRLSAQSLAGIKVRQIGAASDEFQDYYIRGIDSEFARENGFGFALKPDGYTDQDVWNAIQSNPKFAVIDAIAVPSHTNYNFNVGTGFRVEGIWLDDKAFTPFDIDVQDQVTGTTNRLTVIGVVQDTISPLVAGITTSQAAMDALAGPNSVPAIHLFGLREGVNATETAKHLESAFMMNGMDAESLRKTQKDIMSSSLTFNYMLQGFMGLGLVIGVAALGVISARSVVERRQQIGVLRAIGFQKGMVELSFLMESSFIALLGIGVGTFLGLVIAFNVMNSYSESGNADLPFAVPWLNLALIFGAAYAVALLTTFLPARQASQIYPAEALRYE